MDHDDHTGDELLELRDHLELRRAYGDTTGDLLLPYLRSLISEHARRACLHERSPT